MITKGALYHEAKTNYSYGYDNDTLHLRFRALKGEIKKAICRIGDPYIWSKGGGGGNLNAADAIGWTGGKNYPMTLEATTLYHDYFFIEVPQDTRRNRYAFIIEGSDELLLFGEKHIVDLKTLDPEKEPELSNIVNFFCFPYLNGIDVFKAPSWVKDTIWYQIFPDRFNNGDTSNDPKNVQPWGTHPTHDNYMGGDLQGVIDKLDYLEDLGINGIYFCPIFQADKNHKYETTDYTIIDPIFGNNETFKTLVDEAHKRGMRIMLDGVFNHMGHNHPFFQDVVKHGKNSKYFDWFCINELPVVYGNYETFATVGNMPKIDLENPEACEYFLEIGRYWVEEFGIDGWRLDVANEVGHAFWRKFREAVRSINPELYIVGEVWHDAHPWLRGDQFDAVMHYPLMDACMDYFVTDKIDGVTFKHNINHILVNYPRNVTENSFNLLDSHDTDRLLTTAKLDKDKFKLAYTYLFTHAGSPMIYYGDEIGMDGDNGMGSEAHRKCMEWDESKWDQDIYNFMKELIHLRKTNDDLKSATIDWIDTSVENLVVYKKGRLIVLMNKSSKVIEYKLDRGLNHIQETISTNLRNGQTQDITHAIDVKAKDYLILKLKA